MSGGFPVGAVDVQKMCQLHVVGGHWPDVANDFLRHTQSQVRLELSRCGSVDYFASRVA